MAQLLGSAILTACLGLEGSYYQACSKAMDAGTRQIGLLSEAQRLDGELNKYGQQQGKRYFGKDGMAAIGFIGFGAKTVRDQKVAFKLPNMGLCNSINNEIGKDSYNIKLQWDF
jgi:hypothetical protein